MIAGYLALMAATAFTSAAAYIHIVEQPARLALNPSALLMEWKLSYKRGTVMQVSLAVVAALLGAGSFTTTHDWRWLCGALILLALLPYTFAVVMPTNRRLMATTPGEANETTRQNVRRWGLLHGGRTVMGASASLVFLCATL